MQAEQFVGGAFIIGILATGWQKIKTLLYRAQSLLIVTVKVEGDLSQAICLYCWNELKRSPFGEKRFGSSTVHVRPMKRSQTVGFEAIGEDPTVFWKNKRPILISATGNNQNIITISFIRGTWDVDKLLISALDRFNERRFPKNDNIQLRRFYIKRCVGKGSLKRTQYETKQSKGELENVVSRSGSVSSDSPNSPPLRIPNSDELKDYRVLKWMHDELGAEIPKNKKAIDGLAFPPEVEVVIEEVENWKKSENWYAEKQIPWRRGLLLYGKPGTGKTSLVRAIAQDNDLPVYMFDLASMSNEDFIKEWNSMLACVPCVALIEDVDSVFRGRTNILGEDGGGLSFDCLLNCLGGIEIANGVFTVITTNKVETLDEALGKPISSTDQMSTRPGRIDRAVELGALTEECRYRLAERILCDCPQFIEETVYAGDGDTGAQFQERCAQIALREYWLDKRGNIRNSLEMVDA